MYRIQSRCFSLTWDNICVSQRKLIAEWRVDMNTEIKCQEMSCCSVAQSCLTLCDPRGCSMPGFPVLHCLLELLKLMSIESVMPSNHLILCRSLLLSPSIFPNIRVFFNESVLPNRWPKYWSFSFSISSSNEYSGLIPCRIDWLRLLAGQGTLVRDYGKKWGESNEGSQWAHRGWATVRHGGRRSRRTWEV